MKGALHRGLLLATVEALINSVTWPLSHVISTESKTLKAAHQDPSREIQRETERERAVSTALPLRWVDTGKPGSL